MRRVIGVTMATAAACLLASSAAAAPPPPDQACRVTKMLASGAELAARLQCEARHLATGASAACAAVATERRAATFARVEARGGCPTTGDSGALGARVADIVQNTVLSALRPSGPTPSRCTKRLVVLSGRAALRLMRIYAQDGRNHDHARLVERLGRARADFLPSYTLATRVGDCQASPPGVQFYARLESAVKDLRDATCQSCGVVCPCWSAELLEAAFPPGTFDARGGALCDDDGSGNPVRGIVSRDICQLGNAATFPRIGVQIALDLGLCLMIPSDLDRDDTGLCVAAGQIESVDDVEAAVCVEELARSQIYVSQCGAP